MVTDKRQLGLRERQQLAAAPHRLVLEQRDRLLPRLPRQRTRRVVVHHRRRNLRVWAGRPLRVELARANQGVDDAARGEVDRGAG